MGKKMDREVRRVIQDYDPALAYAILSAKGYTDSEIEEFYREYHDGIVILG